MTIKGTPVGNPIVRDRLHVHSVSITQASTTGSAKKVELVCKLYGMDGNTKIFDNNEIRLSVPDFERFMAETLIKNGVAPEDLAQTIADARASANSMNIAECFAAFEFGIGIAMKSAGKFDFIGTE